MADAARELEIERRKADEFVDGSSGAAGTSKPEGIEGRDFAEVKGGATSSARSKQETRDTASGVADPAKKDLKPYSAAVRGLTGVNLVDEEEELGIPDVEDVLARVKRDIGRDGGDAKLLVPEKAVQEGLAVLREGLGRICEVADDEW